MKNYYSIIIFFIFFNTFSYADKKSSYVYCANVYSYFNNNDDSDWHWLRDDNGEYIEIDGVWRRHLVSRALYFVYFKVDAEDFDLVLNMCQSKYGKGFMPSPADDIFSDWRVFGYNRGDKLYFSYGRKRYISLDVFWLNAMTRG